MPNCIFMHTCMSPERGADRELYCDMAPGIIVDKAACQQAALSFHPQGPRSVPA